MPESSAASAAEAWSLAFQPVAGWRQFDNDLLDAGDGQIQVGIGLEVTPPIVPVGVETRFQVGGMDRYSGGTSAMSATVEGQLGLVARPFPAFAGWAPAFGAGVAAGRVEADELVDNGGFIFSGKRAVNHHDSYSGLYLRAGFERALGPGTTLRLEATRYEDIDAQLAGRDLDLEGWTFLVSASLAF